MSLPTVAGLCATLGVQLTPYDGFTAPAAPITAVHVSELLDPTAYLSGGELLLTTGLALPTHRAGCDAYIRRLVRAEVVALGFGLGPVFDEPPPELLASCRRLGLPLLVVPAPTPFLAISKAYWQTMARSSERGLTDALALQQALVDAAASPDPLAGVQRLLAEAVGGWVAVLAPDGTVAQVHPAERRAEAATLRHEIERLSGAGEHAASSFGTAAWTVVIYPMAVARDVVGYLAVGTASKPEAAMRRTILAAAALLSLVLSYAERLDASDQAAHSSIGESVALLLELGHLAAARDLTDQHGRAALPGRARVLVVRAADRDALGPTLAPQRREGVGRWVDVTTGWFLLGPGAEQEQLLVDVRRLAPDAAGVLTTSTPLEDLPAVLRRALDAAGALSPGQWVSPGTSRATSPDAGIDRLLSGAGPATWAAVAAYLRHRGRWEAAARELGLHRNTLRYRIGRAHALLGMDLDDPDTAARLWLALRERLLA